MEELPYDVLIKIFNMLSDDEMCYTYTISKYIYNIYNLEEFWHTRYDNEFNDMVEARFTNLSWKNIYAKYECSENVDIIVNGQLSGNCFRIFEIDTIYDICKRFYILTGNRNMFIEYGPMFDDTIAESGLEYLMLLGCSQVGFKIGKNENIYLLHRNGCKQNIGDLRFAKLPEIHSVRSVGTYARIR